MSVEWPKHEAGLHLTHNEFKVYYQTIEQAIAEAESYDHFDFVSPEQRAKAIETDSLWVLHWYPNTPVGFNAMAAADFETLMDAANGRQTQGANK